MADPFFFGYGSLVNRSTHAYARAEVATLTGWRRVWRQTTLRDLAYLSAEPCADCQIDGLIAAVPNGDWAALDLREHGYDRLPLAGGLSHPLAHPPQAAIYSVPLDPSVPPTQRHPILQSYLDVVFQGYMREFGETGLHHFVTTTTGWDVPLLRDRDAPRYPRAQTISQTERCLFDAIVADLPLI